MSTHVPMRIAMEERGGAASSAELLAAVGHRALEAALRDHVITKVAWGRYVVPSLAEHRKAAFALHGVASHQSAVAHYGWSAKWQPKRPTVTVRRGRHLNAAQQRGVTISWRSLDPADVVDGVTAPLRTVLDCALTMPFDEALAIADSALRSGDIQPEELRGAIASGRGAVAARRVLREADPRAANPLESVLRAIALDIPDLRVAPQEEFSGDGWYAQVDLADRRLGLVLEAEGYETHGTRRGFDRDCERYVNLVCDGLTVLRFTWTQVMYRPDWVKDRITTLVTGRAGRNRSPAVGDVSRNTAHRASETEFESSRLDRLRAL